MNVTFRMYDPAEEEVFLAYALRRGMIGIRGYRTAGGCRASLYNALPYDSIAALVKCMQNTQQKKNTPYLNLLTAQ